MATVSTSEAVIQPTITTLIVQSHGHLCDMRRNNDALDVLVAKLEGHPIPSALNGADDWENAVGVLPSLEYVTVQLGLETERGKYLADRLEAIIGAT